MKPRNKKYVPKKVLHNPMTLIMSGLKRIPYEMSVVLKIRKHYAISSLVQGTLNKEHFQSLIEMVNMTIILLEFHSEGYYLPALFIARDSLKDIGLGYKATGEFSANQVQLASIKLAIVVHEVQLDELRVVDIENAYEEIFRRLRTGHNIVKIKED